MKKLNLFEAMGFEVELFVKHFKNDFNHNKEYMLERQDTSDFMFYWITRNNGTHLFSVNEIAKGVTDCFDFWQNDKSENAIFWRVEISEWKNGVPYGYLEPINYDRFNKEIETFKTDFYEYFLLTSH